MGDVRQMRLRRQEEGEGEEGGGEENAQGE